MLSEDQMLSFFNSRYLGLFQSIQYAAKTEQPYKLEKTDDTTDRYVLSRTAEESPAPSRTMSRKTTKASMTKYKSVANE